MHAETLLCELHAHTTWSDGELTVAQLVDLYGAAGFDVLCVTDHTHRDGSTHVRGDNHAAYLDELDAEAERARRLYGLLVVPGLELTYDDADPRRAAHALALGLRRFVGTAGGLDAALAKARSAGAALVAAHPYTPAQVEEAPRGTARWAAEPEWAAVSVDRFELFNRDDRFDWVAAGRLPAVATGDFHRVEHLAGWKTLIGCAREEEAVVEHLRSGRPVALTRFGPERLAA